MYVLGELECGSRLSRTALVISLEYVSTNLYNKVIAILFCLRAENIGVQLLAIALFSKKVQPTKIIWLSSLSFLTKIKKNLQIIVLFN